MNDLPPVDEVTLRRYAELIVRALGDRHGDVERQMRDLATRESADYAIRNMLAAKPIRPTKYAQRGVLDLLEHATTLVTVDGFWAEFGVYQGHTLRFLADRTPNTIYGFDAFEGLPEDWYLEYGKGRFDLKGALPELGGRDNIQLRTGWFDKTVPAFAEEISGRSAAFLHIDSDLYSSAKVIFDHLGNAIVSGTVIVFDEYFNYPGWQQHEYKAFREFCDARSVTYRYAAFAPEAQPVAVVIESIG